MNVKLAAAKNRTLDYTVVPCFFLQTLSYVGNNILAFMYIAYQWNSNLLTFVPTSGTAGLLVGETFKHHLKVRSVRNRILATVAFFLKQQPGIIRFDS